MSNVRFHEVASSSLLGLYWEPRPQSLGESASLLLGMFERLARAGYGTFYLKGRSRDEAATHPFRPSEEALAGMLSRGANREGLSHEPIPELGRSFALWSGGAEEFSYQFSGVLGSMSPHAKNCLVLLLPAAGTLALSANEVRIKALFESAVKAVRPQEAVVCETSTMAWSNGRLSLAASPLLHWSRET